MNRAELLIYLRTIIDAEIGVYFCDKAAHEVDSQISTCQDIPVPDIYEPSFSRTFCIHESIDFGHRVFRASYVISALLTVLVVWLMNIGDTFEKIVLSCVAFILALLIALVPTTLFTIMFYLFRAPHNERKRISEYGAASMSSHQAAIDENNIRTRIRCVLTAQKEHLLASSSRFQESLQKLYAQNVINERFRNLIAISQLYEYLQIGICTTLEGPGGAYAQYVNDLRTDRICSTIKELEVSIQKGFSSVLASQSQISQQLTHTHQLISNMSSSIQSTMHNIGKQTAQIARSVDHIASNTDSLAVTAKTAAWNQYVAQLESGISSYLLKHP